MGICGSSTFRLETLRKQKFSQKIDEQNESDFYREQTKIKLLLLGAGESGKSTIFKQMKIIYGMGFSQDERLRVTNLVSKNLIEAAQNLLEAMVGMNLSVSRENQGCKAIVDGLEEQLDVEAGAIVDRELGAVLKRLWQDPGVQAAYERRAEFQIIDSAAYFFGRLDDVMLPGYIPSVEDVLHVRARTSGLVQENVVVNHTEMTMVDVGGQRNERRKWIHCFDKVTAVIFVAGISEYDQTMFEDSSINRLEDTLALFEQTANSRYFAKTPMILFLNKRDLFEEKLRRTPIAHTNEGPGDPFPSRFQDCTVGRCTCGLGYPSDKPCSCGVQDAAKDYVLKKFLSANHLQKEIFHHYTFATDSSNIEHVFSACTSIILRESLTDMGLL